MQIDIDFDVFKALTGLREHEGHSYNDVLRDLLGLDSLQEADVPETLSEAMSRTLGPPGYHSRGIHLPNGTQLKARYKQREYGAAIQGDRWLDQDGREHLSPSAAASAITGTNVNGLRFWEAKRPGDSGWCRLELLRRS